MALLVTGSIGIDTIETPQKRVDSVIGGSVVYFSLAGALYADVRMVGVVGDDFDMGLLAALRRKRIDTGGVEVRRGSKTFRWHGRYFGALNERETVAVNLNVLAEHGPTIPSAFTDSAFVFLANTHPALQREFVARLPRAELIVCDTMDLWIDKEADELAELLKAVHGLLVNDAEARQLSGRRDLLSAGHEILKMGPRFVVIKKGEHGSMLVSADDLFLMPAYPTANVVDPTGCGDSFAGALMGYLAWQGRCDGGTLRAALARGSVVASLAIESFSVDALAQASRADVDRRLAELAEMVRFE
jgi:sugar/nucleoside kinase (ribokinase family)